MIPPPCRRKAGRSPPSGPWLSGGSPPLPIGRRGRGRPGDRAVCPGSRPCRITFGGTSAFRPARLFLDTTHPITELSGHRTRLSGPPDDAGGRPVSGGQSTPEPAVFHHPLIREASMTRLFSTASARAFSPSAEKASRLGDLPEGIDTPIDRMTGDGPWTDRRRVDWRDRRFGPLGFGRRHGLAATAGRRGGTVRDAALGGARTGIGDHRYPGGRGCHDDLHQVGRRATGLR